jgi:hypothetical protein
MEFDIWGQGGWGKADLQLSIKFGFTGNDTLFTLQEAKT